MPMEKNYYILKMIAACFKDSKFLSTDTPFINDRKVESEISNSALSPPEKQSILQENMVISLLTLAQDFKPWFGPY